MNTQKIKCPCGAETNVKLLDFHISTRNHDKLFKDNCFPDLDDIFAEMEEIDNSTSSIKEDEYIKKSAECMKKYTYWKAEIDNTNRKWYVLTNSKNNVKIAYRDCKKDLITFELK